MGGYATAGLVVGKLCSSKRQQNALTSAIKEYGALRRTVYAAVVRRTLAAGLDPTAGYQGAVDQGRPSAWSRPARLHACGPCRESHSCGGRGQSG